MYPEYREFKTTAPMLLVPTTADIEGPFYKAGAPIRSVLADPATLHLHGTVFDVHGNGLTGVELDFWQANAKGEYDNDGYTFRGKVNAQYGGRYSLQTIRPGDYQIDDNPVDFRCAHIHVKLTWHGFKPLTTQLYFVADPYNATDHWFDPKRVIGDDGRFDFVLERLP